MNHQQSAHYQQLLAQEMQRQQALAIRQWMAFQGWPSQGGRIPYAGSYPGRDGEMAGNELHERAATAARGVYGPFVQRRSTPQTPREQRANMGRHPYPHYGQHPMHGGFNILGGYNIVGQAAAEAAKAAMANVGPMAFDPGLMPPLPAHFPGLPVADAQWGQAPRTVQEPRRLTMPFNADVTINAGALGELVADPQESQRMERLFIDSDNGSLAGISVRGFFVGQQSQFVSGGSMPASQFANVSVGGTLRGDTANPGIKVRLQVFNGSANARTISASVTGEAVV